MSADDEHDEPGDTTSCYRWSRDFVVAHAVFASGLVTFPVAVLLLVNRPHSGRALIFAGFAAFCTATSLILCLRFYAELRRPPWPRWFSAAAAAPGGGLQQEDDDVEAASASSSAVAAGEETTTTTRGMSHSHADRRHAEAEMHAVAALAAGRVPSYAFLGDGGGAGGAAEDCAVCLGDVEKGETVRRLPACQHVFHMECIDPWLRAHATCPVCRSSVLPPAHERPLEVVWWAGQDDDRIASPCLSSRSLSRACLFCWQTLASTKLRLNSSWPALF